MAAIQTFNEMPNVPPKLANKIKCCYCNSLFQCLFNLTDFWNEVQSINENDVFKQIANQFSQSDGKYFGLKLHEYYEKFTPYMKLSRNDYLHKEHDPSELFNEIILNYEQFIYLFITNVSIEPQLSTVIVLNPYTTSIQDGIDDHLYLNENDYKRCPDILCIKIERITGNTLDNTEINIDKYVDLNIIDSDNNHCHSRYTLNSLICHKNIIPELDHFVSIVIKDDKIFYCNDSKVIQGLPKNSSMRAIRSKCYMLFYTKVQEADESDFDLENKYLEIPFFEPPRNKSKSTLKPKHKQIEQHSNSFPVTSKTMRNTKALIVNVGRVNGVKEIPIENDIRDNELRYFQEVEHNERVRINLHDEYKYLYGYLDVNDGECFEYDYTSDEPLYKMHATLLEKFVSIICNFVYKSAIDIGQINANTTAEALGIKACRPIQVQVIAIGSLIVQFFNECLSKKRIPNDLLIEQNLVEILQDFIVLEKDNTTENSENIESENLSKPLTKRYKKRNIIEEKFLPPYPNEDYPWEERVDVMGLQDILEVILEKHARREMCRDEKTHILRKKLWDDYLSQRKKFKSDKDFIKTWCELRNNSKLDDEITFTESTALKLLSQFKSNEGVIYTNKKLGITPKITNESRLCLMATIMDYPNLTDKERTFYLNTYGPNRDDPVTERTVNNELNKLDFHLKTPAFSPKERNSFGYLVARYLWASVISDIMQNKKVITCFIDEAGVKKSPSKNARGYISVAPVIAGDYSSFNSATILTAVIPGFGNFSRWFEGPVTHIEYGQFIREAAHIIRTKICKNDYQIVIINDNASIHKVQSVLDIVEANNLNYFFTVPYSPQTNLPAENYFSRMKFAFLFEHFIIDDDEVDLIASDGFINNDDKYVNDESMPVVLNGTNFQYITVPNIVQRWDRFNRIKYDSNSSMNIFNAWETVLEDCKNGKELTGQHYKIQKQSVSKINCVCYRK